MGRPLQSGKLDAGNESRRQRICEERTGDKIMPAARTVTVIPPTVAVKYPLRRSLTFFMVSPEHAQSSNTVNTDIIPANKTDNFFIR